jgi:very-short-patch-repair endonuclease
MANFLYNDPQLKNRRIELRKKSTEGEDILWRWISGKQIKNSKFWRQYSVGPYILDFYCPKARLAIELDGNQHAKKEEVEYDKHREEFLNLNNIKTIRFWNDEIFNNIESVISKIEAELP